MVGYQSFVVRLFFSQAEDIDHAQVTHVDSDSQETVATLDEAPDAIRQLLDATAVGTARRRPGSSVTEVAEELSRISLGNHRSSAPGLQPRELPLDSADQSPLPNAAVRRRARVQRRVKRAIDITVAATALVAALPLFLVVSFAIKADSKGPVIYTQLRAGEGGRLFTMYKFRSMARNSDDLMPELRASNERSGPVFKMRDDPRKTRVGRILRRFSLDEVPQLYNVLVGDLSLVGPRPPLASEVEVYEPSHWTRLAVPQGMTGLWQISGRSLLDFDSMLRLDNEYIEYWSLWADIKILAKTVPAVVTGRGAF